MSRADAVRAAARDLGDAGRELAARPAPEVLDALCALLEAWRAPDSPWQHRLSDELAKTSGFSRLNIAAGLQLALEEWGEDALRAIVAREIGPGFGNSASGFPLTVQILGGAIPMPGLISLLLPLVMQSPVLVKPGHRDPTTARIFVESLAAIDPALARCVSVVDFDRSDGDARTALFEAAGAAPGCVVATGSDESLRALAAGIPAGTGTRFIGYGHKLSVAVVHGDLAGDKSELEAVGRALALDVALWDQQGCLSAAAVFVDGDAHAADEVADALASALDDLAAKLPRGVVMPEAANATAQERDIAAMRAADGSDLQVFAGAAGHTVVREASAAWRPTPLGRFVRVYPAPGAWLEALRPLGAHLSTVAFAGFGASLPAASRAVGALGSARVCDPGRMQAPPLGWHHDGRPILSSLARFCDVDSRP